MYNAVKFSELIYRVVQSSPQFSFRTFSLPQRVSLCQFTVNPRFQPQAGTSVMGWPKSSFGFFHKMLGKGYPLQYSGLENSMDCSPWGRRESDTTESLSLSHKKFWPTQYLQFLCIYLFLTFHGIRQCMAFGSDFSPLAQRFQGLSLQHVSVLYSFLLLNSSPLCQYRGFPGGTSGKEPACQCRRLKRHRFCPWV